MMRPRRSASVATAEILHRRRVATARAFRGRRRGGGGSARGARRAGGAARFLERLAQCLHLAHDAFDVATEPAELPDVVGRDRQLDGAGDGLVETGVEQPQLVLGVAGDVGEAIGRGDLRLQRLDGLLLRVAPVSPSLPSWPPRGRGVPTSGRGCRSRRRARHRVARPASTPRRPRRCVRRSRSGGHASAPRSRRSPPCGSGAARRAPPARTRATGRRCSSGRCARPSGRAAGASRRARGTRARRPRRSRAGGARRGSRRLPRHRRARSRRAPSPRRPSSGSSTAPGACRTHPCELPLAVGTLNRTSCG